MSGQDDDTPVTPRDQSTQPSGLTDAMSGLSISAGESKDSPEFSSPSGDRPSNRINRLLADRAAVIRSRHRGMEGLQYQASPSQRDGDDQSRVQTNRMLGAASRRRIEMQEEQRMEEEAAAAQARQRQTRLKRKRGDKLYFISKYSLTSQLGQPNIW